MGYIKHEDAHEAIWRILNEMGISQKNNDRLVEEVDAVLDEYTVADARPVVLCRDCKFSPIGDNDGSDLEWPFNEFDENPCPYKCLDNWYSHKPAPDFFCAAGENRGEKLVYDELVKSLRQCTEGSCAGCKNDLVQIGCRGLLQHEAADAIEELQKAVNFHKFNSEFWEDKYNSLADEKWIPATERLPEEAGKYLVCGRWRGKQTEIWVCDFMTLGCLKGWTNNAENPSVSHWMPLPEPPEEEP